MRGTCDLYEREAEYVVTYGGNPWRKETTSKT